MTPATETEIESKAVELAKESQAMASQLKIIKIKTNESYEVAGNYLKQIKDKMRQLDDIRKSMTSPLDQAKKRVMDFFKNPLDALEQAEKQIKRAMIDYKEEQDRIRTEAERKAREEARKKEEEERRRLEERAKKAETNGDAKRAEELRDRAEQVFVPARAVINETPVVKGTSFKELWKFKIVNEKIIPREYLKIDEVKLGSVVRARKGTLEIPGVEIYSEKNMSA